MDFYMVKEVIDVDDANKGNTGKYDKSQKA